MPRPFNIHRTPWSARNERKLVVLTSPTQTYQPDTLTDLELPNARAAVVTHQGKRAVRVISHYEHENDGDPLAVIPGSAFADGVIEAEIAGVPHADALGYSRGFVGIAFRVQPGGSPFECFFIRPTNGRADDQLRRNHSTQYISHPDYPWFRLREESPGVYESYVDLVAGAWTKIKIVVSGERAQLYAHDAEQPCLIVNDLKRGATQGQIALWVGSGTDAYFAGLTITPARGDA
jgi:hypothetical protein